MSYHLSFDWKEFLQQYWQKCPVLLKQGIKNFIDPISSDELAGLALEDEVDSRLITHHEGHWEVTHGPFSNYDHLGETNWSLLVQAVNHWHIPSSALMHPFRYLPDWRLDDLMVSFSVPGGSIGPHIDQYDVFIIQGSGRRRWRVGDQHPLKQHYPHPDLLQVAPFSAIIDHEMVAGDILYIPPGYPHEGYTLENALNYSVGFRAPNGRELISGFADFVLSHDLGEQRYHDPDIASRHNPADIQPEELEKLHHMMLALLQNSGYFNQWVAEFISQTHHDLDLAPLDPPYYADEIHELLLSGESLVRVGGLRVLRVAGCCYVNGEAINTVQHHAVDLLAREWVIDGQHFGAALDDPQFLRIITKLINDGYWYFQD